MNTLEIWEVEFYPYNNAQGKRIAGSIRAVFTFEPNPEEVLEALDRNTGMQLMPDMLKRIREKDYYLVRRQAYSL